MRKNKSLKQLITDLNKVVSRKRTSRFGLKQIKRKKSVKSIKSVKSVKPEEGPEKKKFNWKKIGMYTLGGLGAVSALYAASRYTKKGQDLRNKTQGVISNNIDNTSENKKYKERKEDKKNADKPYNAERETRANLKKFNGKQNLTPEEKEEKERLETLLHHQEAVRLRKENEYEPQPEPVLFEFGLKKRKKRTTIVRTHVRNIPQYRKPIPKPIVRNIVQKKKINWKKAGMYTLGALGAAGSVFALSRYNKNKNSSTTPKDKNSFTLPFTPMPQSEKQYILEMHELEHKEKEIQKKLSEPVDENEKKELERLLKTIEHTMSEKKRERNKKIKFGSKKL